MTHRATRPSPRNAKRPTANHSSETTACSATLCASSSPERSSVTPCRSRTAPGRQGHQQRQRRGGDHEGGVGRIDLALGGHRRRGGHDDDRGRARRARSLTSAEMSLRRGARGPYRASSPLSPVRTRYAASSRDEDLAVADRAGSRGGAGVPTSSSATTTSTALAVVEPHFVFGSAVDFGMAPHP